jgi:hypothetical protein
MYLLQERKEEGGKAKKMIVTRETKIYQRTKIKVN